MKKIVEIFNTVNFTHGLFYDAAMDVRWIAVLTVCGLNPLYSLGIT
jgi:hypothetical protein